MDRVRVHTAAACGGVKPPEKPKVALATLLRQRTSVSNGWIATMLGMGHPGFVSRLFGACRQSGEVASTLNQLAKALDET